MFITEKFRDGKYPLFSGEYVVYVPPDFIGRDYQIGDSVKILGSYYKIAAVADGFYISYKTLPAEFSYAELSPIKLAFEKRATKEQLDKFRTLGFCEIADTSQSGRDFIAIGVALTILNTFIAAVVCRGFFCENARQIGIARVLGVRKSGVAAAFALTSFGVFIAGFLLALAADWGISRWYDTYGNVEFKDALFAEDFAAVFFCLTAAFAAAFACAFKSVKGVLTK